MKKVMAVNDLHVYYGQIHAIKGVSFEVNENEIVTLIGANGAGKTTILHTLSGLIPAREGEMSFYDKDLRTTPAHNIPRIGLAHVPEGRHVFAQMTVYENLQMGAYIRKDKKQIDEDLDFVFERLPRLKERRKQPAGTLSGGEQQMLAIGRAYMTKPKMMLLDEPTMGLSPLLVGEIFDIIKVVNQMGVTILLVEQNAKLALEVADRAYVLETGKIAMSGNAKDLLNDQRVKNAYLGG